MRLGVVAAKRRDQRRPLRRAGTGEVAEHDVRAFVPCNRFSDERHPEARRDERNRGLSKGEKCGKAL
jgi:hypothetical protein